MLENLSQEKYGAEDISKDMIPYVDELSRDKEGDIRGLSWQSTPGGFWYKKALAKEYLGTDDPDELAAMLSDWDKNRRSRKTGLRKIRWKDRIIR